MHLPGWVTAAMWSGAVDQGNFPLPASKIWLATESVTLNGCQLGVSKMKVCRHCPASGQSSAALAYALVNSSIVAYFTLWCTV